MKLRALTIITVIILALLSIFPASCNQNSLDIPIEVNLTDIAEGATEVSVISITKEKLDKEATNIISKNVPAGEPCLKISTEFKNNTGNKTLALVRIDGYDKDGIVVSQTYDPGPLVWMANYDVPAGITRINMTANWAEGIEKITLNIQMRRNLMDVPIIPATTVPESEMAVVWFDEGWLTANDRDADTETVYITFPTAWLETGKSDSFNGTGIALRVPKQMLLLDDENDDPDLITVRFPIQYFIGRPGEPETSPWPKE